MQQRGTPPQPTPTGASGRAPKRRTHHCRRHRPAAAKRPLGARQGLHLHLDQHRARTTPSGAASSLICASFYSLFHCRADVLSHRLSDRSRDDLLLFHQLRRRVARGSAARSGIRPEIRSIMSAMADAAGDNRSPGKGNEHGVQCWTLHTGSPYGRRCDRQPSHGQAHRRPPADPPLSPQRPRRMSHSAGNANTACSQ